MTQSDLINFMNQRPAINMAAFAKECGMSQALLHLIIQDKRTLTHARAKEVKPVAVKYGYVAQTE